MVQWLRDGLGIIRHASETRALAERADPHQRLYLVPAFTGLGAPYWDPDARGAIFGLTRNSGPAEFARAALESVAYQTRDLVEAMRADWPEAAATVLRVDGGMTANDWVLQGIADTLGAPGRPAEGAGDHRPRRRLARRHARRPLPRPGRVRPHLGARPPLRAGDGARTSRRPLRRLARRGGADPDPPA